MFHRLYKQFGIVICMVLLFFEKIRDKIWMPSERVILFVAHPDDDTLFFHTFIKEHKPYVCLLTDGWSLRRMPDFVKCMHGYGVRYRMYPLDSRDERTELLKKHVIETLRIGHFNIVATHNGSGEYGHIEHIRVHQAVANAINKEVIFMCPVSKEEIINYPLDPQNVHEKMEIFQNIYTTESWVPFEEEAGTPVWVTHEKLEVVDI